MHDCFTTACIQWYLDHTPAACKHCTTHPSLHDPSIIQPESQMSIAWLLASTKQLASRADLCHLAFLFQYLVHYFHTILPLQTTEAFRCNSRNPWRSHVIFSNPSCARNSCQYCLWCSLLISSAHPMSQLTSSIPQKLVDHVFNSFYARSSLLEFLWSS